MFNRGTTNEARKNQEKTSEIIENEIKLMNYEIHNLFEMMESSPENLDYNIKYAKGIYRRLLFLCTIKNREGEMKNAK